jgi:hypothetical protein
MFCILTRTRRVKRVDIFRYFRYNVDFNRLARVFTSGFIYSIRANHEIVTAQSRGLACGIYVFRPSLNSL